MVLTRSLLFATLAGALACSSNPTDPMGSGDDDDHVGGADAGADPGSPDAAPEVPDDLDLEPPEQGFQLRTEGRWLEAGTEIEYCEISQIPGGPDDTYYVNAFDVAMSGGSHHLILSTIDPGTEADMNTEVGDIVPCPFGALDFGDGARGFGGSQKPMITEQFPPGVGKIFHGGEKVIFDYHYVNASEERLYAHQAVNFHTVDASQVTREVQRFGFLNFGISIPPGEQRSFDAECRFTQDLLVYRLTRHTHRWGTNFTVWYAGGPRDGEEAFLSTDYEEEIDHTFAEPELVRAGEGYRFRCEFDNTEDYTLTFGVHTTDEMCILFGTWWVAEDGSQPSEQGCIVFAPDEDGVARP